MDRSERALASFMGDDEELLDTWMVESARKGMSLSPPQFGGMETVGLSNRRLLWLDDELETVDLDEIQDLEVQGVRDGNAPMLVVGGAIAFALGLLASAAIWLATSVPIEQTLAPAGLGVLAFVGTSLLARARDDPDPVDEEVSHYTLHIRIEGSVVQVFGDEETLRDLVDRIESHRSD